MGRTRNFAVTIGVIDGELWRTVCVGEFQDGGKIKVTDIGTPAPEGAAPPGPGYDVYEKLPTKAKLKKLCQAAVDGYRS